MVWKSEIHIIHSDACWLQFPIFRYTAKLLACVVWYLFVFFKIYMRQSRWTWIWKDIESKHNNMYYYGISPYNKTEKCSPHICLQNTTSISFEKTYPSMKNQGIFQGNWFFQMHKKCIFVYSCQEISYSH